MDYRMDKGCCNTTLRKSCIIIASYFLFCIALIVIFDFSFNVAHILGVALTGLANLSLLIGAIKNLKWFVFAWLIVEILYFINWPFELFGTIFNFGGYRSRTTSDNTIVILFTHILDLAINLYCSLIVWSFHRELKDAEPEMRSVPMA